MARNVQDESRTSETRKLSKNTGVISKGPKSQYKGSHWSKLGPFGPQRKTAM